MAPEPPSDPARLTGTIVATASQAYRIEAPIARGGFSVVYRARRTGGISAARADARLAIKVLDVPNLRERLTAAPPAFLDPEAPIAQQMAEVRERFLNESNLLRNLNHPGIVRAFDEGVLAVAHGRAPFFVMEYLWGADVGEIVRLRGRLEPQAASVVTGAVLSALGHLARHGVVHRDVKASNVFVQPSARAIPSHTDVRLIDFGLATAIVSEAGRPARALLPHAVPVRPGMLWGTMAWCPPERLNPGFVADAAADVGADLWGAGLLLYVGLTGVQPFERDFYPTDGDQYAAIVEGRLPAPADLAPLLPKSLDSVARKALSLRPEDRFQTADEFLEALRNSTPA